MNLTLTRALDATIDTDARSAFNALVRGVRDATDSDPKLRRSADALVLLCADAFNAGHEGVARERRWRRFVRALAPVAARTSSQPLLEVVRENKDLL